MKTSSLFSRLTLCVTILIPVAGDAIAQVFPNKPIRAVVPFPAGAIDIFTRTIGQRLTDVWNQQVVVDNRPGASATIGTAIVSKAAPDGYTWLMATFNHAANATLYRKLPYDTLKDFQPVSLLATTPVVLLVHPSVPARSVQEFVSLAKAQPGRLEFASAGNGSTTHLAGELFKSLAGINIVHVPYKGSAPSIADLLGGHVPMAFDPLPSSISHIKAGKLRALAVGSAKRSSAIPELPTIMEAGVPGYEVNWWGAVFLPAGSPKQIVTLLNTEIVKTLGVPEVSERFSSLGYELVGSTPAQLGTFIETEIVRWGKVIRSANIRAD